jgi:uncharacterized protein (TIGR00299 family) protein
LNLPAVSRIDFFPFERLLRYSGSVTDLLIEPFGGMAGDMLLAALIDLGDSRFTLVRLRELAERLLPGEAKLSSSDVQRGSLRGLHLKVETPESESAPHRHLSDLLELLERADLSELSRTRAAGVLRRIAEAESRVHGIAIEAVHFHEVGAVDTLIDVTGAVLALELLGVERVFATAPLIGDGTVHCAHGEMPVPAPATAELLRGMPVRHGGGGERLTPTGAALLAELCDFSSPMDFQGDSIGYGAGTRDPKAGPPNLVRVQLGKRTSTSSGPNGSTDATRQQILLFEFQVDDATGEELSFCLERLRELAVLDVWTAAVQMKKGRSGVLVTGLIRPEERAVIERVIFDHCTTLGIRYGEMNRTECARETFSIDLDGQPIRIKRRIRPHAPEEVRSADLSPEFEDLAVLARASGVALRELEQRAVRVAYEQLRAQSD